MILGSVIRRTTNPELTFCYTEKWYQTTIFLYSISVCYEDDFGVRKITDTRKDSDTFDLDDPDPQKSYESGGFFFNRILMKKMHSF
jgi:hypothetical protein